MEDVRAARAGRRDADPQRDRLPGRPRRLPPPRRRLHDAEGRLRLQPARRTTPPRSSATCGWPGSSSRRGAATSCRRACRLPGPVAAGLRKLEPLDAAAVARAARCAGSGSTRPCRTAYEPAREVRPARRAATRSTTTPTLRATSARRAEVAAALGPPLRARRDRARPALRRRQHGRAAARARLPLPRRRRQRGDDRGGARAGSATASRSRSR